MLLISAVGLGAAELKLPEVLVTQQGEKVTSVEMWKARRRPEILDLFRQQVYGRSPIGRPQDLSFKLTQCTTNAMEGKATRKQVEVSFSSPGGRETVPLVVFIPNTATRPVPCFLLICNRPVTNTDGSSSIGSGYWPPAQIVARGYAAAAFCYRDIVPDKRDGLRNGVFALFDGEQGRRGDSWGAIAAWAWGASRMLDCLQTDREIDGKRVALVGQSRGGKTALWAGAEDERFGMLVSNESGSTGAALARHKQGEQIRNINTDFPHWFCENYKRYNGREEGVIPVSV